jgi:hypothetical protein
MWFYQSGIMRAVIKEPNSDRFQISSEDIPVVWDQLTPVAQLSSLFDITSHTAYYKNTEVELYTYDIQYSPFMIT